jgi:hypothetical protein
MDRGRCERLGGLKAMGLLFRRVVQLVQAKKLQSLSFAVLFRCFISSRVLLLSVFLG